MTMMPVTGTMALAAIATLLAAAASLVAIVALRLRSPGGARCWLGPAFTAASLVPAAVATAAAALGLKAALEGLALVGTGGVAAVSAGLAEALAPLLLGLLCSALLGVVGLACAAFGEGEGEAGEGGSPAAVAGALALPLALIGGLIVLLLTFVERAAGGGPSDPAAWLIRLRILLWGAPVAGLGLAGLSLAWGLSAPRGRAPFAVSALSLVALAALVTGAAAGLWHAKELLDCLMAAAMTGTPCSPK